MALFFYKDKTLECQLLPMRAQLSFSVFCPNKARLILYKFCIDPGFKQKFGKCEISVYCLAICYCIALAMTCLHKNKQKRLVKHPLYYNQQIYFFSPINLNKYLLYKKMSTTDDYILLVDVFKDRIYMLNKCLHTP